MLVSADKIHDGKKWLHKDCVLELSDDGTILAIRYAHPKEEVQYYEGILCPGFVNAHCHTELAHLRGQIPKGIGLSGFLQSVVRKRNQYSVEEITSNIEKALTLMYNLGIQAVGDVVNTAHSQPYVENSNIKWTIFSEAIGFNPAAASASFERSQVLAKSWENIPGVESAEVCAHAPYSVSEELFQLIAHHAQPERTQTIHNQEWEAENELYLNKKGAALEMLETMNIPVHHFKATGKTSVLSYVQHYSLQQKLLLVHNTYTTEEEMQALTDRNIWWCLCPNANLYIEQSLPDVMMMKKNSAQICLGTDSLASNDSLDMFSEMLILKKHFPLLEWELLLRWATSNGASALGLEGIGRLRVGTKPGVININRLNDQAVIHRIQ